VHTNKIKTKENVTDNALVPWHAYDDNGGCCGIINQIFKLLATTINKVPISIIIASQNSKYPTKTHNKQFKQSDTHHTTAQMEKW